MRKILLIVLVLVFVIKAENLHFVYARAVTFPDNTFTFNQEGERPKKLILIPVKKYSFFNISNEKYVQELIYYFMKYAFLSPPIHYVVFEDGSYYVLNDNFAGSSVISNLDTTIICVLLVYAESFQLSNFKLGLESLIWNGLHTQIMNSDIQSTSDIEVRELRVDDVKNTLIFSEPYYNSYQIANIFDNVDYKTKILYSPTVRMTPIPQKLPPDSLVEVNFAIQNNTALQFLFGETSQLKGVFEKDSIFYTSQDWLNTRTIFIIKNGSIKPNHVKNVVVKFRTPLLPGEYSETLNIYMNNEKIDAFPVLLNVDDVGQKVLMIKRINQWSLAVRAAPKYDSQEIARVAPGAMFLYTDQQNDFYKIRVSGKDGWIPSGFVEIVKSQ